MVVLFGAGSEGRKQYQFLKYLKADEQVDSFCDNHLSGRLFEKDVIQYEEARKKDLPFVITVERDNARKEISDTLRTDKVCYFDNVTDWLLSENEGWDRVWLNREFCAFYHEQNMDTYFENAEKKGAMDIFWEEGTAFLRMFNHLDLSNVVELACGRGRHLPRYIEKADEITMVDILDKNIEYCKKRFNRYSKISYYKNNGHDLRDLPGNTYTSLFTYDSMVHFELMDIYSYLVETFRILKVGSYALFHHSNDDRDYRNSFEKGINPGGRSFMSKKIFAYLAYRAGFSIVEQQIIDWSEPGIDCLTLVRKDF